MVNCSRVSILLHLYIECVSYSLIPCGSRTAKLRVMLREAKIKGNIPPELADLEQDDFLRADYEKLKDIVDKHKKPIK